MNKFEYRILDWAVGGPLNRFILGERGNEDRRYGLDSFALKNADKIRALVTNYLPGAEQDVIEATTTLAAKELFNHAARQVAGRANLKAGIATTAGLGTFFVGLFGGYAPLLVGGLVGTLVTFVPQSALFQSVRPEYNGGKFEPGHKTVYEQATANFAKFEKAAKIPKPVAQALGFRTNAL